MAKKANNKFGYHCWWIKSRSKSNDDLLDTSQVFIVQTKHRQKKTVSNVYVGLAH